MNIIWKGSPNFWEGRRGQRVDAVVIHVGEGSMRSIDSWFASEDSKVSAHYAVGLEGAIHQYVREEDSAWHAGRRLNVKSPLVLEHGDVNPNLYTIGIEHEGTGKIDFTEVQYGTTARLLADIGDRYNLNLSERTVIPHHDIFSDKTCPGPIDMKKLIRLARALSRPPAPPLGTQVWSGYYGSNLTLVKYDRNDAWWFTVNTDPLKRGILRAETPFSAMPPGH